MIDAHHPVLLDFESRSRANLKAVGGRNYWQHPSSVPLCCAWFDTRDGTRGVWLPGEAWPHPGRVLAAHNMTGFDRFAAVRLGWLDADDRDWIDTSELARRAGLPGKLDELGTRWIGVPKDKAANRFTVGLSSVRRPREVDADTWKGWPDLARRERGRLPDVDLAALERVVAYCELDVAILESGWSRLVDWIDVDADTCRVDRVVNDRGVAFDADLARALLAADARNAERAVSKAARALGWTVERTRTAARSPEQFADATGAVDAKKNTVLTIDHPLAAARLATASIARGKLLAGLCRASPDGRLRDTHRYYGASTGRWSGKGMQLQNLPRPSKELEGLDDDGIARLVDRASAGLRQDEINVLLRATIIAPPGKRLVVSDFAGVEARANAWAAGDEDATAIYRDGKLDVYKVMATTIFGVAYADVSKVQRTVGKVAELACGYGMGGAKFGWTAAQAGADLDAAGVDPFEVVAMWRDVHAPIVRFWYACERAFAAAIAGRASSVACFEFCPGTDGSVGVFLPSGRPIVYLDPECGVGDAGRTHLVYRGTKGREHIYGGKIVENLIQAWCRDLMALALVECERVGLCPVMHVHDEIVCEVDAQAAADAEAELRRIMLSLPDWAPGFPVGVSSFTGRRYRK